MKITEDMRQLLVDILNNTERLDKISIAVDPSTRTITIRYDDLDEEWFDEMALWMADAAISDGDAASDVCERCLEVFKLIEGCPCAICNRRHWHGEICYSAVFAAISRWDWSMERTKGTRLSFAQLIFYEIANNYKKLDLSIGTYLETVVVGFLSNAREGRVQIWVRDLVRPYDAPLPLHLLVTCLREHAPSTMVWEVIEPPPHEHLPR
jgi:hypothetical protein